MSGIIFYDISNNINYFLFRHVFKFTNSDKRNFGLAKYAFYFIIALSTVGSIMSSFVGIFTDKFTNTGARSGIFV